MKKVGIVGEIASGKTLVARIFRKLGAYVIDADEIGHQVLMEKDVISELIDYFGRDIINKNGGIDREKLGELAFATKDNILKLNEITHPKIEEEIAKRLKNLEEGGFPGVVVVDAALLCEWEIVKSFDHIVYIQSPQWHRIKRLVEERKFDIKEAEKRVKAQSELAERATPYITLIIRNTGEPDELRAKVMLAWKKIRQDAEI